MKNHFENAVVEHSFGCSSVACLLGELPVKHEHCSVNHFDTTTDSYHASSLHAAAEMWVKDGMKPLVNVGVVG